MTPANVPAGTRVQIRWRLLDADQRAPGLPSDTAALPYDARARGILLAPCTLGEPAAIRTQAGRQLAGVLELVEPADTHTYGRPHAALVAAADAIGALR